MGDHTSVQSEQLQRLRAAQAMVPPDLEPIVDALVGQLVDKWTITILEQLGEQGVARFTQIARAIPSISQKMLTQTLKRMERDGLVIRTIYPVMPPHVDYRLTDLGMSLGMAFCTVWVWAAQNVERVQEARHSHDARSAASRL